MMSENPVAVASNRDLATMPLADAIESYAPHFAAVLPPNISVEHFRRILITAINTTFGLAQADRRTLFNAAVKCASDGLLPDGREAALVVYRTKVKDAKGAEHWIDAVQYLPMVAGIRKRMRNSGDVISATAEVVYRNDRFQFRQGDDAGIEHEPAGLDQEPGEPIGAYAIIKLKSGEVIREVMRKTEIEAARKVSRSPNGPMWRDFWGEGARKVVLRRASKAVPQAAAFDTLLARDNEPVALPPAATLPLVPPRPEREEFDDLPAHVTTPEMHDEETGEVQEAPDPGPPAPERNAFWALPKLFVPEMKMLNGRTTDWPATKSVLLAWIGDAITVAEVRRLQRDSEQTLNGLKGAYVGLYDEVVDAIQKRVAELEGGA